MLTTALPPTRFSQVSTSRRTACYAAKLPKVQAQMSWIASIASATRAAVVGASFATGTRISSITGVGSAMLRSAGGAAAEISIFGRRFAASTCGQEVTRTEWI